MDKPRIYVDFNEMVTGNIVLLSKDDTKRDSNGYIITFYEEMAGKMNKIKNLNI
jgi:hypothetical protein